MLKAIISILVALAAMVGVIAYLGSRLPQDHVVARKVVIGAPVDVVFAMIADFESSPSWRPDVRSVSVTVDPTSGRKRVTEESSTGTMMMEVDQAIPPRRLVMRIVGEGQPFGGTWVYALDPQGTETLVTITEHGEVYNPVFRFIAKYIMGHTRTIDAYLVNLAKKFGRDVVPIDAVPDPVSPGGAAR